MTKRLVFIVITNIFVLTNCTTDSVVTDPKMTENKQTNVYETWYYWEDSFSKEEKNKLKEWIQQISTVMHQTLGIYQFNLHYHFHQSTGNEPVPYAHTSRKTDHQAVHFYVNPKFSLDNFLSDWTAQHEISHLSLPFVGKSNMWFSEGYATYMSRQIMVNQGYYTGEEFDSIYYYRIANDENIMSYPELTVFELCNKLKQFSYSSLYYTGSVSFSRLTSDYRKSLVCA